MINVPGLAKVMINIVLHYHGILKSIISNQDLSFTSKL